MFRKLIFSASVVLVLGFVGNVNGQAVTNSTEDFETNDFSKFPWEHYGDKNWTVTSWQSLSGAYSAQAGAIEDDESTTLQVRVDCASGNITFHCKVSSESGYDYLKFYIDGVEKGNWSGEEDWAEESFPVAEGTRTFEWTYSKDGSMSEGEDTAWIDDIEFTIEGNPDPVDEVLLLVRNAPADHLAAARFDLTPALQHAGVGPVSLKDMHAFTANGQEVPCQLLPDGDFNSVHRVAGTIVFKLPQGGDALLRLEFAESDNSTHAVSELTVRTPDIEVTHRAEETGGLPCEIRLMKSDTLVDNLVWREPASHSEWGGYRISHDSWAEVEKVAEGPLCTVVRVSAEYTNGAGEQPPSNAESIYYWCYFHDLPLILVNVSQRQDTASAWGAMRFFELHPGDSFDRWAGCRRSRYTMDSQPFYEGQLTGSEKPQGTFWAWVAISDGRTVMALMDAGSMRIYDGRWTSTGTYLLAHKDSAWADIHRELSAWFAVSQTEQPWAFVQQMVEQKPVYVQAAATTRGLQDRVEVLEDHLRQLPATERRQNWWRLAAARQLQAQSRLDETDFVSDGTTPEKWQVIAAGEMGLVLEETAYGVRPLTLFDSTTDSEFLTAEPLPLFRVTLQDAVSKEEVILEANSDWTAAQIQPVDPVSWHVLFERPKDERLGEMAVSVPIRAESISNALHFDIHIRDVPEPWCVRRFVFPQLKLAEIGEKATVLYPSTSGRIESNPWRHYFNYNKGGYPGGFATMAFLAAYDHDGKAGLYFATHDPWASERDISVESCIAERAVVFSFDYPAPDMDQPGNGFELSGEAVWQLFRGDWFDASIIYRDWVREHAKWYPELSVNGREDTPLWMRELPAWVRDFGHAPPEDEERIAKDFSDFLGLPMGLRYFGWEENDAPFWFPAEEGFAEAVEQLQGRQLPVYVMPFIIAVNDVRFADDEDSQPGTVVWPETIKDELGQSYIEGNFVAPDGRAAMLVKMCPASQVWHDDLREIVMRLFEEYRVKAVYLDGLGAGPPPLCFDHSHGHPTGGGHWGVEAYWEILQSIRRAMPSDCILTTERGSEAYVHVFDGFLNHWNGDKQVPAFPAIYGGTIQMFCRFYAKHPRPTRSLAHRMLAGQQFVFGEQIGGAIRLPAINNFETRYDMDSMEFVRQLAWLRWDLRRFFYAGEMARPPKLNGKMPTVTADWVNMSDGELENWVTTDAVLTGAWKIPHEQRLVLLFVNVSDMPLTATLDFDAARYGLPTGELTGTVLISPASDQSLGRYGPPSIPGEPSPIAPKFQRVLSFPSRYAWAWIIEP